MESTTTIDDGTGVLLGELRIISFGFAPKGWAFCNGQLLPINQNQALFSLLGTKYGGDGRNTFALPNLQGRAPVHMASSTELGAHLGSETATVSLGEMATHTHPVYGFNGPATSAFAPTNGWATVSDNQHPLYSTAGDNVSMSGVCLTATGGGPDGKAKPHENRQPYIALHYMIATAGDFPAWA